MHGAPELRKANLAGKGGPNLAGKGGVKGEGLMYVDGSWYETLATGTFFFGARCSL